MSFFLFPRKNFFIAFSPFPLVPAGIPGGDTLLSPEILMICPTPD